MERSYGELAANITAMKKGYAALGYSHKHIALIGTSSVEWIQAYMSIVTSDNAAVPLDSALPAEDLIDLVARSDSEGVYLDPKFAALAEKIKAACPKVRNIWLLGGEAVQGAETVDSLITAGKDTAEPQPPKEDDVSMIVYTSGTTGKSKGVMLTQCNLYSNIEAILYDEDPGLVFLSVLPVHHAFCLVMDWLNGFWMGSVLCINDSLMHMIRNISIFQPDVMLMVPLMLETIYKRVKALGNDVPPEILVRGTSVMKGYYNMPEETGETLKDGWLHTGDKGYMDEDGFLFINGRVKNLIILSNGENISPEEIETKLALNDLIDEIIVTGEDNLLTARIYPEQTVVEGMSKEEIRSALQKILDDYNKQQPTYKQLSRLVVRDNPFIKNSSKKIIRHEVTRDEPMV